MDRLGRIPGVKDPVPVRGEKTGKTPWVTDLNEGEPKWQGNNQIGAPNRRESGIKPWSKRRAIAHRGTTTVRSSPNELKDGTSSAMVDLIRKVNKRERGTFKAYRKRELG